MFRANTVFNERCAVLSGAVADMIFEAVFGVFRSKFNHIVIAGDLGDNRGGGDFSDETVGFFERGDVIGERGVLEEIDGAVDDDFGKFGFSSEDLLDGAAGGEFEAGGKSVAVELGGGDPSGSGSRGVFMDKRSERGAFFGRELLGISKAF